MSMLAKKNDDNLPSEKEVGYLGYGVDLFHVDPWVPKYKSRILIEQLQTERHAIRSTGYHETYADSFLKLVNTLTVEAGLKGSYGDFSGSVNSKFNSVEKRTEKRHLEKISFVVSGNSHAIKSTKVGLTKLLNEEFKDHLADMDPGKLLDEYGTHLAYKIITGGRAEFFCQTEDLESMSQKEFEIIARSKYKGAGGKIEGHQSTDTTNSKKEHLVSGSVSVATVGGSAKGADLIKTGDWSKWATSCEETPGFLGYDEDDGLVPIWELATDPTRRAAIHEAYQRTAALALKIHLMSETSIVASRPETRITVPKGYKLLSGGALNNWTGKGSFLTASFPNVDASGAAPDSWDVQGKDHLGDTDGVSTHHVHYFPEKTSVTAIAMAIYDPDDIWEVKTFYPDQPSGERGETYQSVTLSDTLSEADFVLVGGGAKVLFSGKGSLLTTMFPEDSGKGWFVRSRSHLESEDTARITGYLVALRSKVKGVKLQTKITKKESTSSVKPSTSIGPPSGYMMVGGGASLFVGLLLTASYPKDLNTWEVRAKDHGVPYQGKATAYCIGLKVVA